MSGSRRVFTSCTRDCPNTCGLAATVENGRLTRLGGAPEHPLTKGRSCVKCAMYVDRVYSPERVLHPLVRENRSEPWRRASWDEALDLVAGRMKAIRDEHGYEAILYYQGFGERTALKLLNKYFFNLFGPVTTTRGTICGGTGQASQNLDVGDRVSHDPLDHYNSNSMVLWARNPVSTNISLVPIVRHVRDKGGTVIVIDPFKSKSASLADRHITPAPGRDGFLAMAVTKLIFEAGAQDERFMAENAVGAAEYKAILNRYTFAELCAQAGVPEEDAQFLARTMLRQHPTSILLGWGLHRHEHAHLAIRAIDALGAISGNIGVPGGGVSQGFEEYGPFDPKWWGDDLHPGRRTLLMPTIGEELLNARDPEIRMILSTSANPVCMCPNSDRVAQAFAKTDFVVYCGHFMDDTADLAHVFLPCTTFLEEDDIVASYGHNYVGPINKAIEPVGECRSEFEIFQELSTRFPFADQYRGGVDHWLKTICTPLWDQGCDLETLRREPFRLNAPMVPYADGKFPTPSGKFQFMTEFDPSVLQSPDETYPYRLLTVAPHKFLCSERTMAEHEDLPLVQLHPDQAARKGVADGGVVEVVSSVGHIKARLKTVAGMRQDCLVAERGGWIKAGHGLNKLTWDMVSKVGNGAPYYETCVTVRPCAEEGHAPVR